MGNDEKVSHQRFRYSEDSPYESFLLELLAAYALAGQAFLNIPFPPET
jgi:hypothetical protein